MKIAECITHNMGGFEIEAGEISNTSTDKREVVFLGCVSEGRMGMI